MDTERIVKMSPAAIRELVERRGVKSEPKQSASRRRHERWPFPGTVEIWLPDKCYGDQHILATLHNLSLNGLAMRVRRPIPAETRISLAIHQPEMTCYGRAVVRHCTRAAVGYLVGAEFYFRPDQPEDAEPQEGNGDAAAPDSPPNGFPAN
jgi:hypothetical protein